MSGLSGLARARRLLLRPDAWIDPVDGAYAVRITATRRGRIMQTLDEAAFSALAQSPGLRLRPAGGWTARRAATQAPDHAGLPGIVVGERALMSPEGLMTVRRANLAYSPIAWLARHRDPDGRPWLGAGQVAAADRLSLDSETALRAPSVTMRWDALPRSGGGSATRVGPGDAGLAAAKRVEAALAACGPARSMIDHICLRTSTLQAAEQGLGLKRRTGKALLIQGLTALAAHYRIG